MLHDWEENLAIITANRTKDDELVTIHLGDCLWKDKGEVCCVWISFRMLLLRGNNFFLGEHKMVKVYI